MFVFTFVAGLFTFQYDKPHFDPLPRLPPNMARTHTDSPVMSRSSFCHVGDSITIFSVCVGCASRFHHRGKSLSYRTPRRVNPPNLPFYCGGVSPPFPLAAYAAATGGLQERLATMFVVTSVAGLFTCQHDKPHLDPSPRSPPNRATATIVLLNHKPSHSYVVSLPDATVGILPMSDRKSTRLNSSHPK